MEAAMKKTFWDRTARIYNRFMKKDEAAYEQLYRLIRPVVQGKNVLELAAGTGLISKNIAGAARSIEVTDASPDMIAEARRGNTSTKLHFAVQNLFQLPYADESFDVVLLANALHIIPEPEKALAEARRVLKRDGVLLVPTFTHKGNSLRGRLRAFGMRLVGFPLQTRWSSEEYLAFLRQNGWHVRRAALLRASFPLTYAECVKTKP